MLWRGKIEEQADLQQALELQSRRLVGLQLLDVQKHHPHKVLSTGNPIPSPTHSPSIFYQTLLFPLLHNSSTEPLLGGLLCIKHGLNGEKRKRNDDIVVEKPREVIHVRTKEVEEWPVYM
ncbi:hypothetical protein WN943_015090 [Citrus x changshan-huyou]